MVVLWKSVFRIQGVLQLYNGMDVHVTHRPDTLAIIIFSAKRYFLYSASSLSNITHITPTHPANKCHQTHVTNSVLEKRRDSIDDLRGAEFNN